LLTGDAILNETVTVPRSRDALEDLVRQHSRLVYRSGSLKIGTRVPIELKQGEIEYFDLGTRISARIQNYQGPGPAGLSMSAEISSLAAPDQSPARDVKPILAAIHNQRQHHLGHGRARQANGDRQRR
jgi:hypothetical protein